MSAFRCSFCNSEEIDFDPARGVSACIECGTVLEQNAIVNEVGFSEDARGRSNLVGQHVHSDGRINSFSALPGYSRTATDLTMQNGRRRLGQLVSALKLKNRHVDSALRLFRMAVELNFHKGRKMATVCASALYSVCRIEKTPHMLLDFADVLETNLFVLGHTFLKFVQKLALSREIPFVDPSLYIHRFASKLEFGDKTHIVAMSALRVLARMQRDWMSEGRRPSGICGAALLVASRMHHFHRTQADVARVVRIGNVVLRERLLELVKTPTAALTAKQIDVGGGDDGKVASLAAARAEDIADPPAFRRLQARKLAILNHKRLQIENAGEQSTQASQPFATEASSESDIRIAPMKGGRTAEDIALEGELKAALASRELRDLDKESTVEEELRQKSAAEAGSATLSEGRAEGADKRDFSEDEVDSELSDLEEEDNAKYLNTEAEFERKSQLWHEVNKDYLEKQERLEKMKKERPEEYKRLRPSRNTPKKKRAKQSAQKDGGEGDEGEVVAAPPPPKPSKKLNYSVLKNLADTDGLGLSENAALIPASGRLPPLPP